MTHGEQHRIARQLLQTLHTLYGEGLTGVADDSRRVRPGDLFLAYPGHAGDGRRHIPEAIRRGAKAVLWEETDDFHWDPAWQVPQHAATQLRALSGALAHEVAGQPTGQLSLLAVTGTNGKTSISQWLAHAYPGACACIGTLGAGFPGELVPTGFTTPEAPALASLLAGFVAHGARACALEASSIGIEEGRLNGCQIDSAIFTNCTRDHLDYHGSMEAYAAAKEKLFHWPRLRLAVLNLDDEMGRRLAHSAMAKKIVGYTLTERDELSDVLPTSLSINPPDILRAEDLRDTAAGQSFRLVAPQGEARVETALLGRYNVGNLLAVAAILLDRGFTPAETADRLAALRPPPGRMERHGGERGGGKNRPLVVVDYAHTPDALENTLDALRPVATARGGRLFCLFGCGGDRDPGKRPQMGAVAAGRADALWITDDNPRGEDPAAIRADILQGIPEDRRARCAQQEGRGEAIGAMLAAATPADVCLVAGKGHEAYQEIRGERRDFSDAATVEENLARYHAHPWQSRWLAGRMHWELADIAQCIGARLLGEDTAGTVAIDGVATDSRVDCAGKLFVALAGEKFDAHDYLEMAVRQGAAALLVSRAEKLPEGVPALLVADTRLALGALAAAWRSFFSLPLIALTGSNGKTTSKEMIARILEAAYEKTAEQTAETAAEQTTEQPTKQAAEQSAVLATSGNFNNDVGLPLTLLKLRPEHRAAVIEMGMSHPGEIAVLGSIARPTVALVTNAGHAHLEGMANLGAVAAEKGTIYASLPEDGLAVINEDDPYADFWRGLNRNRRVVGFSLHGKGEVNGTAEMRGLCTHLRITHHGWSVEVSLAVPGLHNAMNALAAAAAAEGALAGQVDRVAEVVRRGLTSFAGVKGRLQARPLAGGATLLDDTYNANPDSVRAGIDVLASTIGKKLLVLGDMGEIGQSSAQFHDEIGGYAKSMGIDRLYTLGENSQQAARNFGEGARHFPTPEALVAALRKDLTANATVLVKGSRFMRMERVVELLGEKD